MKKHLEIMQSNSLDEQIKNKNQTHVSVDNVSASIL